MLRLARCVGWALAHAAPTPSKMKKEPKMSNKMLPTIKLMTLILTLVLALISILYILNVFPGALATKVIPKLIAVMAIITATALITIFLASNQKNNQA
jgi:hypothetical protein